MLYYCQDAASPHCHVHLVDVEVDVELDVEVDVELDVEVDVEMQVQTNGKLLEVENLTPILFTTRFLRVIATANGIQQQLSHS